VGRGREGEEGMMDVTDEEKEGGDEWENE